MSAEQNKVVARRVVEELFNQDGNLGAADGLFTSEYVCYVAGSEDLHGAQAVKHFASTERQAIPDLKNTIEDQVAEGDKVVTRYRTQGTHTGETEAFGPPTGNRIDITGMVIDRVDGSKIAELDRLRRSGDYAAARIHSGIRRAGGRELGASASNIQSLSKRAGA
jgi:predicted ester cyclase